MDFSFPYFGSNRKPKKNNLQDRAEDIAFEEIKETSKAQPKIDEKARAGQIANAVESRSREIVMKNPITGLLVISLFVYGAKWADEHPISTFDSRAEWVSAQRDEVQRILDEAKGDKPKDLLFEVAAFAMFHDGAVWADEHPAPTL